METMMKDNRRNARALGRLDGCIHLIRLLETELQGIHTLVQNDKVEMLTRALSVKATNLGVDIRQTHGWLTVAVRDAEETNDDKTA